MATAIAQIRQNTQIKEKTIAFQKVQNSGCAFEKELILLCSRNDLTPEQINRVSFLLSFSLDWEYLLGISNRNGVLPLVSKNLLGKFKSALMPEIKQEIQEFYTHHTQHNIFITGKLIEIIKMLESNEIPALPFKGPTLAMRAFKNLSLRQFVDLDILIQPKHFDKAVNLFLENGYKVFGDVKPVKDGFLSLNRRKDLGLINERGQIRVELHWKLSGAHFAMPLEVNELWNRLETINLGGTEIKSLPFHDLFVYLCLHGSRHGWEKLAWICDLCELVKTEAEIDWESVRRHAQKHGCEKVLELGLFLAREFFDLETDYPNWEKIERDETFKKAAGQIREKNFARKFYSTEIGDWYLYHLMLKEKKTDRLKLHIYYLLWYLRLAFRPNAMDKAVFHLPKAFYPLYYILRPSRLLFGYFSGNSAKK